MEALAQQEISLSQKSWRINTTHQIDQPIANLRYEYQDEDIAVNLNTNGFWDDITLVQAAQIGRLDIVKYLISLGADVNMYHLALWEAVSQGHKHIITYLLALGADVNMFNCLIEAVTCGDVNIVKSLLEAGANVNQKNNFHKNALEMGIQSGNVDIVNLLIEFGADVNLIGSQQLSPLMIAVDYSNMMHARKGSMDGFLAIAKSLIQAGADVNRTCLLEKTILMRVSEYQTSALMMASKAGNFNMAQILIEAGADVNKMCEGNQTALMFFALNLTENGLKGVRLLLRSGAKVNICRQRHWRMKAKKYGRMSRAKPKIIGQICRVLTAGGMKLSLKLRPIRKPHFLQCLCRAVVRRHLLKLDPHENLFLRIPRLGLPSLLVKYLLFDASLESDEGES